MSFKNNLKQKIMLRAITARNRHQPFNLEAAEFYALDPQADEFDNNSYYFSGHNLDGCSLFFRLGNRGDNTQEVWLVYKDEKNNYFGAPREMADESINATVQCLEAGKRWSFSYHGPLVPLAPDKKGCLKITGDQTEVSINSEFVATDSIFDFTYDLNPQALAHALAQEKWDHAFRRDMMSNSQRHYEQRGKVVGLLETPVTKINFSLSAVRDHSYGRRDWNYMNRHIWLLALMPDGSSINLNFVSYPSMRVLITGYYQHDGAIESIIDAPGLIHLPVDLIPQSFKLIAHSVNGKEFVIEVKREAYYPFQFADGKYHLYEGLASYTINGQKGRGIAEFGFNDDRKRSGRL